MNSAQVTVMGPGGPDSPASLLAPPIFDINNDKLAWREAVSDWSENVIACAKGGDNRAKGIAACLALTLYRSLPAGPKDQIKQAVRSGEITIIPTEDDDTSDQMKFVSKIVRTVACENSVDRIARMVRLNKQVHACVRKTGESMKDFICRFKVPSFAYLNIIKADIQSAESQIFAMTLIMNAKLGEQVFSNTISTLISGAKNSGRDKEVRIALSRNRIEGLVSGAMRNDGELSEEGRACVKVAQAALKIDDNLRSDGDENAFISLADALTTLELLALEQKALDDPHESTKETTVNALMGENNGYGGYNRYTGNNVRRWNGSFRPYRGGYQGTGGYNRTRTWNNTKTDRHRGGIDLREDIEKKRNDRLTPPDSKNEDRYRKKMRLSEEPGQSHKTQYFQ